MDVTTHSSSTAKAYGGRLIYPTAKDNGGRKNGQIPIFFKTRVRSCLTFPKGLKQRIWPHMTSGESCILNTMPMFEMSLICDLERVSSSKTFESDI